MAKLGIPELVLPALRRQRLRDLLDEHLDLPLTVVTGPPGSGKTQLVAAWVADELIQEPTAWVTLDDEDRVDTVRLWRHVLEALRHAGLLLPVGFWNPARWHGPVHAIAAEVASALHAQQRDILLVLDNAAVLTRQQCTDLESVLRNAGGGLRMLLLGRSRPGFPLHRYRLTDALAEIDAADLALDEEETAELLDRHGVRLTPGGLADLVRCTEGWLVGVRLGAAALAVRRDAETAVRHLGAEAAVREYLTAEVLDPLPPPQRAFLHRLGVLHTFSADLAVAVCDLPGGPAMLDDLLHAGILAELPGAAHPPVYRLNQLFADVLRARLRDQDPAALRQLHLRAARWWAAAGDVVAAVEHAGTAELWDEAADIIVEHLAVVQLMVDGRDQRLLHLLTHMPHGYGSTRTVVTAAVAIANGHGGTAERLLDRVGALPAARSSARLRLCHAAVGLAVSLQRGDAGQVLAAARSVERLLNAAVRTGPPVGPEVAGFVVSSLGTAQLWDGQVAAAADTLAEGMRIAVGAHCDEIRLWCGEHLTLAEAHHGRLDRAAAAAEQTRVHARTCAGETAMHWAAVLDVALALTAVERLDTTAAWRHLTAAEAAMGSTDERFQDLLYTATLALVRARLLRAGGDLPAALGVVRRALRPPPGRPSRDWLRRRLIAVEARILIAMGRPDDAADLVAHLDAKDDPATDVLAAEALFARGQPEPAAELARAVADTGDLPPGTLIDAWLLLAAVDARAGRRVQAEESLRRAVAIAVPEGIIRPLYEAGDALHPFLRPGDLPTLTGDDLFC